MPPQTCVDGGCTDRMDRVETRLDHIDNPESGALGQIHEKINGKVSLRLIIIAMPVALLLITGAYAYTTLSMSSLRQDVKEKNKEQDARTDKLVEMQQEVLKAIYEHRIYSGEKVEQKK